MTAMLPLETKRLTEPVLIKCTRSKLRRKKYCVITCGDDNDEEGVRLYAKRCGWHESGIDWVEYPGPTHSLRRDLTAKDRFGVFVRHILKYRQLHGIEEVPIFVHSPCGNYLVEHKHLPDDSARFEQAKEDALTVHSHLPERVQGLIAVHVFTIGRVEKSRTEYWRIEKLS